MISTTLIIILFTILSSYLGFTSPKFFNDCSLNVYNTLHYKQYRRVLTIILLHNDWKHLLFNMLTFFFFGSQLEASINSWFLLLVYFASAVMSSLVILFFKKNDEQYIAVGASGAVAGVVFSAIVYNPYISVYFIPGFVFAIGYLCYSIFSMKNSEDNVAHEGHIGGAVGGIIVTLLVYPKTFVEHYWIILAMLIPLFILLYLTIKHPAYFFIDKYFKRNKGDYTLDDKFNQLKKEEELSIDAILDKINEKGIRSLTKKEKRRLDEFSKK